MNNTKISIYHLLDYGYTSNLFNELTLSSQSTCKHFYGQQVDDFLKDDADIKLCFFEVTYLASPPRDEKWIEIFNTIYSCTQKCFIFVGDLDKQVFERIQNLDLDNVIFFAPGFLNSYKLQRAKLYYWNHYELEILHLYTKKFPEDLENKLDYTIEKTKIFDILLGQYTNRKNFIYNHLKHNHLLDHNYVTYINSWGSDLTILDQVTFLDKDITLPCNGMIKYKGYDYHFASIIPTEIYNITYYSAVIETNCSNDYSFSSEKIIKPILSKRLFVVFAGQYFLYNLRKLGFMTFDGIVDESYDLEPDEEKRFLMAVEQIKLLGAKKHSDVYLQIENILVHNKTVALNLEKKLLEHLEQEINNSTLTVQTIAD